MYEWTKYIRGEENLYMDYIANPKIVEAMVDKVSNFTGELARRFQEIGLDILSFYDDFGAQDKLQISPGHWRQFVKPAWKRIWEEVRSRNKDSIIFLHSCGCVEEIIPDLIEIGLDVLHPIQPETMDVYEISRKYQKDLALWGTVSNQRTIPLGTPDEIDREIRERVEKMGKKGGFIVSPANIMGPEIPMENIDAFAKACEKYCTL
jgi:uroporphyrinogen decarboxylase